LTTRAHDGRLTLRAVLARAIFGYLVGDGRVGLYRFLAGDAGGAPAYRLFDKRSIGTWLRS
jgi:hypothetical protein